MLLNASLVTLVGIAGLVIISLLCLQLYKLKVQLTKVTQEKLIEEVKLKENKHLLQVLISDIPCSIAFIKPDFTINVMNNELKQLTGKTYKKCIGKKCYKIFTDNGKKCSDCPVEKALQTGRIIQGSTRELDRHNRTLYLEQTAIPVFRSNGSIKYIMEIIVDATEKVQLQLTMDKMYLQIVKTLVNLIEDRDAYTATHSMQVHDLAIAIGKELNIPKTNLADKIGVASILHDIGKIGIPERILNKPGKLLNSEFKIMEKHCLMGYNSLKDIKSLHDVAEFILHHHENFNGSGYPDGLKGTDIPIVSRIIRVADVYSALTTNRAYRPAMQREQALKIIVDGKYKDFDPAVVNALLKVIKKGVSRERLASSR